MIRLESEGLVCTIEPQLGSCIGSLWLDGVPVLRSTGETPPSARQSGCHPLVSKKAPEPHAIHGVGWERPWTVLDGDDGFVMLAFEHGADAAWPFAFDSSQTLPTIRGVSEGLDADCTSLGSWCR